MVSVNGKRPETGTLFEEALKQQEEHSKKHQGDLDELARLGEQGRRHGKAAGVAFALVCALVVGALVLILARDPSSRALGGFVMMCVALTAAYRYWRVHG